MSDTHESEPDPAAPPGGFPMPGLAVVIGATGGIGAAMTRRLGETGLFEEVVALGRRTTPALDLTDEASIEAAAAEVAGRGVPLRLVFDATGFLHDEAHQPEKSWRHLTAEGLAHAFALNAIGPALLMKHFLPLMAREGKSVFATLSAKVGSITDNGYGGWYGYRASKAALNQIVRTAAIEASRRRPGLAVVAMHPGTVDTPLSAPFSKAGLAVRDPDTAAGEMWSVIAGLDGEDTGRFLAYDGRELPW